MIRGISEHYTVEVDGEVFDDEFTFVCVCNGRYYGGGFNPVPEADPADGKLDVLLVKKVTRSQVPFLIGKYKDGRYRELAEVAEYRKAESVKVLCDKPVPICVDGELRTAREINMTVAQEKLRFFYPKGLSWRAKCKVPSAK